MVRELLSIKDIKELNKLLRQVFNYITNLKTKDRLADKIKYPQLPSILTESLAIHLLKKELIIPKLKRFNFNFGGREADILAIKNSQTIKIEVKATAKSAFQYFSEKDISADYIIWFHFADFYMKSTNTKIEVYIIKNPSNYFNSSIKITLTKLKKDIGSKLKRNYININSL